MNWFRLIVGVMCDTCNDAACTRVQAGVGRTPRVRDPRRFVTATYAARSRAKMAEAAALRVGLYANIGVRAEVADRWAMFQRLLPYALAPPRRPHLLHSVVKTILV